MTTRNLTVHLSDSPELHPASGHGPLPEILVPYEPDSPSSNKILSHFQYLCTPTGLVIRDLNSSAGVPLATYNTFRDLCSYLCHGCSCVFTLEGFNAHLQDIDRDGQRVRVCGNDPRFPNGESYHDRFSTSRFNKLYLVASIDLNSVPDLRLRTYTRNKVPGVIEVKDYFQTPLGFAFSAFNSRIGVPEDVHTLIITAVCICDFCCLVRTLPADRAHRDEEGNCVDPGIGEISKIVLGKGKAKVVMTHSDSEDSGNVGDVEASDGALVLWRKKTTRV